MFEEKKNEVKGLLTALEVLGAVVFIFGALWESAEVMTLSPQGFMMLYGALDVITCEIVKRVIDWKFPESEEDEGQGTEPKSEEEESD